MLSASIGQRDRGRRCHAHTLPPADANVQERCGGVWSARRLSREEETSRSSSSSVDADPTTKTQGHRAIERWRLTSLPSFGRRPVDQAGVESRVALRGRDWKVERIDAFAAAVMPQDYLESRVQTGRWGGQGRLAGWAVSGLWSWSGLKSRRQGCLSCEDRALKLRVWHL